jgi:hypothetical protein
MPLTIADLHSLLYGFEEFESCNPISKHPCDHVTLHRIKIIPISVGLTLAEADKEGKLFHIEFYPALHRAEVWSAQAWRESLTRHLRLKDKQRAADPLYSLQSRLVILESQIVYHLFSTVATTRSTAERVAQSITRSANPEYLKAFEIFNPPADLFNDVVAIRDEFNKLAPLIVANHPLSSALERPADTTLDLTTITAPSINDNATHDAGEEYPAQRD